MSRKSSKGSTGRAKAKRKTSKAADLPVGNRKARSVKGGAFAGGLTSPGTRNTIGGHVRFTI